MNEKVKVLLVENDDDYAFLISKIITDDERLEYLGHVTNRAAGVEMSCKTNPDIVVMDLNLSGSELDGIEAAKEIRLKTGAKVIFLTSFEQPDIMIEACKRAFASAYIFKSQCRGLADVIYQVATSATPQEGFIKKLLLNELSPAEISIFYNILNGDSDMHSSQKTIANQKTNIFKKMAVKNSNELIHLFKNW